MTENEGSHWFDGIETVVSDPLRFKKKLAIGEDAYTSLRVKNAISELWQAAAASGTAVAITGSAAVASAFFAPAGPFAFLGIGTAATPIGWLLAAGIVAGGGWVGVTRYLKKSSRSMVTVIPEFINTPTDLLAVSLFNLMAPLALKVASVDGEIDESERGAIASYFVKEWGLEESFVREGIIYTESRLPDFSIETQAKSLAEFKKSNKDCNYSAMSHELVQFLREIIQADGHIDEREEMAIENVQRIFNNVGRFKFMRTGKNAGTLPVSQKTS